jgi:hypothetical protein
VVVPSEWEGYGELTHLSRLFKGQGVPSQHGNTGRGKEHEFAEKEFLDTQPCHEVSIIQLPGMLADVEYGMTH